MIPGIIGGKVVDRSALKKIWDDCKVKDMPFEQFVTEIEDLTDPIKMTRDLMNIRNSVRK